MKFRVKYDMDGVWEYHCAACKEKCSISDHPSWCRVRRCYMCGTEHVGVHFIEDDQDLYYNYPGALVPHKED